MQHLIKHGQRVDNDDWTVFDVSDDTALPEFALLPVSFWHSHGSEMADTQLRLGAFVSENEDIDDLLPHLGKLTVVAFRFGKFADGRAFSYARQLRSEHGFEGEIRAFGDILPDQVNYLQRCGFDAFALRTAAEADTTLMVKDHIKLCYQSDALEANPLFRRRA